MKRKIIYIHVVYAAKRCFLVFLLFLSNKRFIDFLTT